MSQLLKTEVRLLPTRFVRSVGLGVVCGCESVRKIKMYGMSMVDHDKISRDDDELGQLIRYSAEKELPLANNLLSWSEKKNLRGVPKQSITSRCS